MSRPTPKDRTAITLTEARARLFPLVNDLLAGHTDRVALSRRGADQHVLLVRARDLERLEAELAALRRRAALEPRPLAGSATATGDVEDIPRDARREANVQSEPNPADVFSDAPASGRADVVPPPATWAAARAAGPADGRIIRRPRRKR